MLSKTGLLLAAAFVALGTGAANADSHDRYDNNRPSSTFSISFGNVAFGYRDGYWDNRHHWHHWRHHRDQVNYRSHGGNYHNWNHDRDNNQGWPRH